MKKIILCSLIFIISLTNSLFSKNSEITYLRKLVGNGYIDVAVNYAKKFQSNKDIKIFLYKTLIDYGKFNELLSIKKEKPFDITDLNYTCRANIFIYRFNDADNILDKIKEKNKNLFATLYSLERGIIYYKKYDFKKALPYLTGIKEKSLYLKKLIAKIYILTNAPDKAKIYINGDKVLSAEICYETKNYKKALSLLKGLNSANVKILRYNCLVKLGKFKEAEKELRGIKKFFQKNFSENIRILIDYKKFEEAEAILSKMENNYLKYYFLGKIFMLKKNYITAASNFRKALLYDNNSEVLYLTASCYEKSEAYSNAAKFYDEIIKRADSANIFSESVYHLGFCYFKEGNFVKAEKFFKKYLNNEENNLKHIKKCIYLLAVTLEKEGKFIDAIKYYDKYRSLLTDKEKIRVIELKMADLWDVTENYQFEAEILKKFYPVKRKKDLFILRRLGDIYGKTGHFAESNGFYKEYLNKTGKFFPDIFIKIGLNNLYANNLNEAKENFLNVIDNGKSGIYRNEALFWVGKIYMNLKNYKLAQLYFQRLYNSDKSSPLSIKAIKYICYIAYKTGDKNTLTNYLKLIKNPFEFVKDFNISMEKICKKTDCSEAFVIIPEDKAKYSYFKKLYAALENKDKDKLRTILNSNRFHGVDRIVYFYIGKIFYSKDLENQAILAFNKFLNNNYNSFFKYEYSEAVSIVLKYYFSRNNYEKIIALAPIYSKLKLNKELLFIIGYSEYKYNLATQSRHYLTKFIQLSNNGNKIFKASFYLDKMGFLNEAEKGYLKADKFIKDNKLKMELYYWLGEIYNKKGEMNSALNYFLKIKLMFPYDVKWTPTAAFKIAKIFEQMKNYKKALNEYYYIYKKLPDNDPRKSFVKNRMEKLQKL